MNKIDITTKSLEGLQKAAIKISKRIDAPEQLLPTFGFSRDFGYPHIEVDANGLHYVVRERGKEQERKTTNDPHELLYWIFKTVTFSMACQFELKHRVEKQDCRRIIFYKQAELMKKLDYTWADRVAAHHSSVLRESPFDDMA